MMLLCIICVTSMTRGFWGLYLISYLGHNDVYKYISCFIKGWAFTQRSILKILRYRSCLTPSGVIPETKISNTSCFVKADTMLQTVYLVMLFYVAFSS